MAQPGLTLDTGAIVALEHRKARMLGVLKRALEQDLLVTVPSAVLVEWFRGGPKRVAAVLDAVKVEALTERVARLAGEALQTCPADVSVVDAIVMASAAQRGDYVYTGDIKDLQRLSVHFPSVRIFSV